MKLRKFFGADNLSDLIIIHDDFDVSFLNIKIKSNGGHGGHNGVKDIIKFNGEFFHRVKLGIRNSESLENCIYIYHTRAALFRSRSILKNFFVVPQH